MSDPRQTPFETRRKLLRAGFGVPAMTVVASGSALAATSSTCLARQLASPIFPAVTTGGDNYLRVQLGAFTPTGGGAVSYYVDGANVAALSPRLTKSTTYSLTNTQVRAFNIVTNTEGSTSQSPPSSGGTYTRTGGRFAALRFDASGQIVGVGQSTTAAQSAVTNSCWSSVSL